MGAQFGYRDENTGFLYLLGHRFYDAQFGQFMTRDPMGYGGGVNLYGYTGNNPVNEIDPMGYNPTAITIVLAGGGPEDPVGDIAAGLYLGGVGSLILYDYLRNHQRNEVTENRRGSKDVGTPRREWERQNDQPWPKDENGKNKVCEHKLPLADGGADDGTNVEPLSPEEHTQRHKDRGDFKRWGGKRN